MPRCWLSLYPHYPDKMNLNLNGMVSMWKMRELVDKATNIVMNYTETEAKVNINHIHEKNMLHFNIEGSRGHEWWPKEPFKEITKS